MLAPSRATNLPAIQPVPRGGRGRGRKRTSRRRFDAENSFLEQAACAIGIRKTGLPAFAPEYRGPLSRAQGGRSRSRELARIIARKREKSTVTAVREARTAGLRGGGEKALLKSPFARLLTMIPDVLVSVLAAPFGF